MLSILSLLVVAVVQVVMVEPVVLAVIGQAQELRVGTQALNLKLLLH
jgi:hypothetical protein